MMQFIQSHLVSLILLAGGGGALTALAFAKIKAFAEKEVDLGLTTLLARIKDPKVRAFCVTVDKAVEDLIPDGGDAKYAMLADLIIREAPEAAPARPLIIAVLSGLGAGAKAGIADAMPGPTSGATAP